MSRTRGHTPASTLIVVAMMGLALATSIQAEPVLQLYLEGGTYNATTESWELTGSSSAYLWVIGAVGSYGSIFDVHLAVAYDDVGTGIAPSITLTGSTIGAGSGEYMGFLDPSKSDSPSSSGYFTNGQIPLLNDGSKLPKHGIYGAGTDWQRFELGNLTLTDSTIGDFLGSLPDADTSTKVGQINAYQVSISGAAPGMVFHFDVYNHVQGATNSSFAPFSHDGEVVVPAPGAVFLGAIGLGLVGGMKRRFV